MLLPCCCHVAAMLLPCCCHVAAMLLACCCHVAVMLLSCCCHVAVMLLACCCHVAAMLLACCCHVAVMLLSCCCHVAVMLLPCCCHVAAMLLSCCCPSKQSTQGRRRRRASSQPHMRGQMKYAGCHLQEMVLQSNLSLFLLLLWELVYLFASFCVWELVPCRQFLVNLCFTLLSLLFS